MSFFVNLKDTKYRIVSAGSNSAHTHYVKTSGRDMLLLNAEQSSIFQISAQSKYTHFQKKLQYSFIKNISDFYEFKYHTVSSIIIHI